MKTRKATIDDVTITITIIDDDTPPEDCFASGDPEIDKADCAEIREHARWNPWAWCIVKLTATLNTSPGIEGHAYLGACSYESEDDFRADGYYLDMVDEALADINQQIDSVAAWLASEPTTV